MKLDMHVHSGFSECAQVTYRDAVDAFASIGENFVLCNHYNALYTRGYGGRYGEEYPRKFVEEFYNAREYGVSKGIKVFFGIEVAICMPDCPYAEFLIYGARPQFLLDHPLVYELSQRELYELCEENSLLLVQAHPFRKEQGHFPHDMKYVHGVEINCHFRFLREEEKVRRLAEENKLIVTCGSDFHMMGQQGAGGIICGDAQNEEELGEILKSNKFEIFTR